MTKKASKEIRVSSVLDAAMNEFLEKGYENASMDSISAKSGLTKGGLYYHFKSKDDILIKVNERFMEPVRKMINESMKSSSAVKGISLYIKKYLTYWHLHPRELSFIFLTFMKTLTNDTITNMYYGYTSQVTHFLTELYQMGIDKHEFRSFSPKSTALALLSALDGVIAYVVLDDTLSLDQTIKDFTEVFVNQYII
jgi:AcrR family transcriptional regulator